MSPHRWLDRRARLRARALREPFRTSRSHVLELRADDPVVVPGNSWQRALEATVFRNLGLWHQREGRVEEMTIRRMVAHPDSLEVDCADPAKILVGSLVSCLPSRYPGFDFLESGYPGMRYRLLSGGLGVELYILGRPCSLMFLGIDAAGFEADLRSRPVESLMSAGAEQRLLPFEVNCSPLYHPDVDLVVSALVRRLGILLIERAESVDMWVSRRRVSVEIITCDRSEATFNRVVHGLSSPYLSLRFVLVTTEGYTGYRTHFRLPGCVAEVDLRIQSLGRG